MLLFRLGFAGADGRRAGAVGCHDSGAGGIRGSAQEGTSLLLAAVRK